MKILFTLIMVIAFTIRGLSQVPENMSYQAIIRNENGELVKSNPVGMKISILQGSLSGTPVYVETQNPTTNVNGLVTLEIGGGTSVTGTFEGIDWSTGTYFIKTETDPSGGTNYTIIGTSQLLSVPYALYAKASGNGFSGNWNDLINKPSTLNGFGITDGINTSHASYGITSTNITNWTEAYNWGNHATFGYLKSVSIQNQAEGDIMYFNGTNWERLPKGTSGQILAINSSGLPVWIDMFGSPNALTEAATNVRETSATLNCTVNSRGLSTTVEFEYGIDVSYGSKVSILENPIIGNSPTLQSVNVYGLLDGRTYHFRVRVINAYGSTYGDDMTFSTISNNGPFTIGKSYGGGIIFYLDNTGQHGLVCATSDQIQGVRWNNGTVIPIVTSRLVGTGQSNTTAIVNAQGPGIYAASICDQLILNGYTDWFLPSIDELQLMYNQKAVIGGFTGPYEYYWSSSESSGSAFLWSMVQGGQAWAGTYDIGASVRAIRAF